jgi:hypothetical protein
MTPPELETICLGDVPENSFIILRIDVAGPMEKNQAADRLVVELDKYKDIFTKKKLTLMIMTPKENINILTEEEMNQIGWVRKMT